MKIAIASDHGGFNLKNKIIEFLEAEKIAYQDFGVNGNQTVDYPDFGEKVALAVVSGEFDKGICICGTGIGIGIAANKVPGIRAALCHDTFSARASREHNDANILCMGERVIGTGVALEIVKVWLEAEFAGNRHSLRLQKLAQIEKKYATIQEE